ncbi:MAG: PEP/pyruvate-binding domain-containing protein [Bacteroidia bacterium]|nr:PEP/pyruvate-binding domain-containing protein [Bacteroidia bacterium]
MHFIRYFVWYACVLSCTLLIPGALFSQDAHDQYIQELVQSFKKSRKGPYKDIRWFCPDGSIIPPKEACPEPGGHQRARYNDETESLALSHHLFFGQILATTPLEDFWDVDNRHSRLKQFQIEMYLRSVDNGWILQRAQYYRGAIQIEDEEAWSMEFLLWLLNQEDIIHDNFFLVRQIAKDIPHKEDSQRARTIRALSKDIADGFDRFTYLRVKIHGQPEFSDIPKVVKFQQKYARRMNADLRANLDKLILEMEAYYKEGNLNTLRKYLSNLSADHRILQNFQYLADNYANEVLDASKLYEISDLMWSIRKTISTNIDPLTRLNLLDLSVQLEEILNKEVSQWQPRNLKELLLKTYLLSKAAVACGFIESWEWEQAQSTFKIGTSEHIGLQDILLLLQRSNSWVEWSTGMVRSAYLDIIDKFAAFEPLSHGFMDDLIRRSVLIHLGQCVNQLGEFVAVQAGFSNGVLDLDNQARIRGLNPGYTKGELVVADGPPEDTQVSRDKIYIFRYPSSELKPVAGIGTVSEGNPVSHMQLLARNLGIPNAVFSYEHLEAIKAYSGREVFYAVSNAGTVIMKEVKDMTADEDELFAFSGREETRIHIPTDRIDLDQQDIINLRDLDASFSGKVCGPKAANLAQLKKIFPDHVVNGLVIPFGVFRSHMEQEMPEYGASYWQFINETFTEVRKMEQSGYAAETIDYFVVGQLSLLRSAIQTINLNPEFVNKLESDFSAILGHPMGQLPVFVRSDTNMEDLKEFTGSGLNLTVFNVVAREKIIQGIKDVWASPFKERAYQWRQQYMLNPEDVYPSILIIPTVDVDHSGVLITKGLNRGTEEDLTVAFNFGGGGAVAGQATESYILYADGRNELLSPARESMYRKLPKTGGSDMFVTDFATPILSDPNLMDIRQLSAKIQDRIPVFLNTEGPFDVELGFKDDKLWLFQIRPFIENKRAKSSLYLESITPKLRRKKKISLSSPVNFEDYEL